MRKLSKKAKKELAALTKLSDSRTDFSGQPEVRVWNRAVVGKFYRANQPIKR
jgi:hypothetical protein